LGRRCPIGRTSAGESAQLARRRQPPVAPHRLPGAAVRTAGLVNVPGALCWNELATPDFEAAQAFYGGLFGWTFTPFEGEQPYFTIQNGERPNGGMRAPQPGEPPNWLVYFATDDADGSMAKVEELGGNKLAGPFDLPIGRIAIAQDPQGAAFALYAGDLAP
jgi:predicted enzyme related to lactoylglutathione lyase